jgi:DNA-binding SARP family transcriptional activator
MTGNAHATVAPGRAADARLRLLGGFELRLRGQPVALQAHAQRLVAVLALRGSSPRSVVAGTLWPDVTEQRAQGNLRTAVWRLHAVGASLVDTSASTLELGQHVDVDVARVLHAACAIVRTERQLAEVEPTDWGWLRPAETSSVDLLPGWDDEWIAHERDRVRQIRLHALESLSRGLIEAHRYGQALELAMEAVRTGPLRESSHRLVIDVHLAERNVAEALRAYHRLRRLLLSELGVEPSADLADLFPPRARNALHV